MIASAVLWLTSMVLTVTLTDSWQCDCEYSGCVIHNMGAAMYRTMNKILPGDNFVLSPIGLWSDMVYIMKAAKGETKTAVHTFVSKINQCKEENMPLYFDLEFDVKDLFWPDTAPFWLLDVTHYRGSMDSSQLPILSHSKPGIYTSWTFNDQCDPLRDIRFKYVKNIFNHTHDFIQKDDIGGHHKMSFAKINYVKIHDKWRTPFHKTHEYRHKRRRFAMMQASGVFYHGYDDTRRVRYVFLECEHRGVSMVLVLPESGDTHAETDWDMFYPEDKQVKLLNLTIPKFAFEVDYSLIQVLRDNCGILLTKQCDLSGVNGLKDPVNQVIQKTLVRVDEEGLMFEAYTVVISGQTPTREQPSGGRAEYKPFFYYLFYDQYIIAQGRITDPSHA